MQTDLFSHLAQGGQLAPTPSLKLWQKPFALPAYLWVLVACALTLLVHIAHIPLWLSLFGLISLISQLPPIKRRFKTQKSLYKGIQLIGFLGGIGGLWLSFGQLLMTDVSICFLVLCLFGKLWELYSKRDAYVALNLCLFVIGAGFLWSQSLTIALLAVIAMAGVFLGFIALADDSNTTGAGRVRALLWVMLPAVPLLVVLFLFFPRFEPLWTLNIAGKQATTGLSDTMSPGDFANLSKSTELAFRAQFDQAIPSRNQLYWRALVLDDFDGTTWRQSDRPHEYWINKPKQGQTPNWANFVGHAQSYHIMMEPTQQNWLFGLDYSKPTPQTGQHQIALLDDFSLRTQSPIGQKFRYSVQYFDTKTTKTTHTLDEKERHVALQLPSDGNPKSRVFAKQLFDQAQGDTARFVDLLHTHISQDEFYYTLSPPRLHKDRIDEFLFDKRQGFCEHYASSFVFLARSAGVPSRVVTGYQGGQLGRDGKVWEVRQMDAHAWAEVWIDGQGWVRVDPTAFVAPNRILEGMSDYTEQMGASVFGDGLAGELGYHQFRLLQNLYRLSDEVGYQWQKHIVGFDSDSQKNTLSRLGIGKLSTQIFVMMGGLCVVMVLFAGILWYKRKIVYHPFDKPIYRLSIALAKHNNQLAKHPSESFLGYLNRLQTYAPVHKNQIQTLAKYYRQHRFGTQSKQIDTDEYEQSAKQFAKQIEELKHQFHTTNPPKPLH